MRVRLRNGYTQAYVQIIQYKHMHKAVTGCVEAKKLLSHRRQSNYNLHDFPHWCSPMIHGLFSHLTCKNTVGTNTGTLVISYIVGYWLILLIVLLFYIEKKITFSSYSLVNFMADVFAERWCMREIVTQFYVDNDNCTPSFLRSLCEFGGDCFGPRYFSEGSVAPEEKIPRSKTITNEFT